LLEKLYYELPVSIFFQTHMVIVWKLSLLILYFDDLRVLPHFTYSSKSKYVVKCVENGRDYMLNHQYRLWNSICKQAKNEQINSGNEVTLWLSGSLKSHVIMTFIFLLQAAILLIETVIHKLRRCADSKGNRKQFDD